jgi:hypothetical protein
MLMLALEVSFRGPQAGQAPAAAALARDAAKRDPVNAS